MHAVPVSPARFQGLRNAYHPSMRTWDRRTVITLTVLALVAVLAWSLLVPSLSADAAPTPAGPVYGGGTPPPGP
jgi:hypothetical protein